MSKKKAVLAIETPHEKWYREGFNDCCTGLSRNSCHYHYPSNARQEWMQGFDGADQYRYRSET